MPDKINSIWCNQHETIALSGQCPFCQPMFSTNFVRVAKFMGRQDGMKKTPYQMGAQYPFMDIGYGSD